MSRRTLGRSRDPDDRSGVRWVAVVLAGAVAAAQVGLQVAAEQRLQTTPEVLGQTVVSPGLRWAWVLGWSLPWVAGAILLAAGRHRVGVATVLTASAVLLADGLAGLSADGDALQRGGQALVLVLALAAAVSAWLARPRGAWRDGARGPSGPYVAVAVLAWLPSVFKTTAFAPPGAPRRFLESKLALLSGLDLTASLAGALVALAVLWVAPRLRPEVGAASLVTFALLTLAASLGGIATVVDQPAMIFTPSGVLGLVGVVGLLITAVRWSRRAAGPPPPPTPPDAA